MKVVSDCCSISNVWWRRVLERRAKLREGMIDFRVLSEENEQQTKQRILFKLKFIGPSSESGCSDYNKEIMI